MTISIITLSYGQYYLVGHKDMDPVHREFGRARIERLYNPMSTLKMALTSIKLAVAHIQKQQEIEQVRPESGCEVKKGPDQKRGSCDRPSWSEVPQIQNVRALPKWGAAT